MSRTRPKRRSRSRRPETRGNAPAARSRAQDAPTTPSLVGYDAHLIALGTVVDAHFHPADPFAGLRDPLTYLTLRIFARIRGAA